MHALLLAAALLGAAPATSPADLQRAKQLFEQGRTDYRNGEFRKAVYEFLEADKIKPSPALLYNVAQAYEKLGDQGKAVEYYQMYLQRDPTASDREAVKATIQNLQSRIEAEPQTTAVVVLAPDASGAPTAGGSGARTAEAVPAGATTPTASVDAQPNEAKPKHSHALALTLGIIGLAAGGVAIVGAVEVNSYQTTYNQIVNHSYVGSYSTAQSFSNQANVWGISAIVLAVVAAAGLTTAAVTW